MAVLTSDKFTKYKHTIRRDATAKSEQKKYNPPRADWNAAFQSLEDQFVSGRAVRKTAVEAALKKGVITDAYFDKLEMAFLKEKYQEL